MKKGMWMILIRTFIFPQNLVLSVRGEMVNTSPGKHGTKNFKEHSCFGHVSPAAGSRLEMAPST